MTGPTVWLQVGHVVVCTCVSVDHLNVRLAADHAATWKYGKMQLLNSDSMHHHCESNSNKIHKIKLGKISWIAFQAANFTLNQQQEETFHSRVGSTDLLNVAILSRHPSLAVTAGVALTSFGASNIIQGSFQTKLRLRWWGQAEFQRKVKGLRTVCHRHAVSCDHVI